MRLKEEEGLSGSERLPRAQILRIRSKVRRDRLRLKQRVKKMERKLTSMGIAESSQLGNSMKMKTSNLSLGLSPFRGQSGDEMHRTQTVAAGLNKDDSSMVGIQGFTTNQRMQENTRNAGQMSYHDVMPPK